MMPASASGGQTPEDQPPGLSAARRLERGGFELNGKHRVQLTGELRDALTERAVGPAPHERLARVEGADRAAVLVDDLVVDLAPERRLGVVDVDAGVGVR